jgi:hypothetical protein
VSVTEPTKVRRCTPGDRHFADQAVTSLTMPPISVFIHDEAINGKTNDGQHVCETGIRRALSNNGTVVGVKEPRGAWLTPVAGPVSLAADGRESCDGSNAAGDLGCSRSYGAVYAGGVPVR